MKPPTNRSGRLFRARALLCVLMFCLASSGGLAACADQLGTARPREVTAPTSTPARVVVRWIDSGGYCVNRCPRIETQIWSDGRWAQRDTEWPPEVTTPPGMLGTIDEPLRSRLLDAIAAATKADFAALPITEQYCPSIVDGRDRQMTFSLTDGDITVSNCDINLATANHLLNVTDDASTFIEDHIQIV
jgi:hypothetical protein